MFSFAVCLLWTVCATALAEYIPAEGYQLYHPYETEYAPKYDNYEPKDYHFEYAVSDPHTGDHKSQWEVKEKGVVRGMYSLLEPDGTIRVVEYIADDGGFRATVKKLANAPAAHPPHQEVIVPLSEAYGGGYSGAYSGLGQNYNQGTYATPIALAHGENHGTGNYITPIELGHGENHDAGGYIAAQALGHGENHNTGSYIAPIAVGHGGSHDTGSYTAPIALGHNEHHDIGSYIAPIELGHVQNQGTGGYIAPIELGHGEHHGTGSYIASIPLEHGQNYGTGSYIVPIALGQGENHGAGSYIGPSALGHAENHGIGGYIAPISAEVHGFTGNFGDDSSYANYGQGNNGYKRAINYQNHDTNHGSGAQSGISAPYKISSQYQKPYAYSYVG